MSRHLTNKQYMDKGGLVCPICRSEDIEGWDFEPEGAYRDISCNKCGATWQDVYELKGYNNLEEGIKE